MTVNGKNKLGDDPPAYEPNPMPPPIEEPPLIIPPLDLRTGISDPTTQTVSRDECVAHLKFLAVLADLRDAVAGTDGLFGLMDPDPEIFLEETSEAAARIKEKRWAIYVTRAVDRYAVWWRTCVRTSREPVTTTDLETNAYDYITEWNNELLWTAEWLPPLDVLMVWHAHMLNPRAFLEDCIRDGKMGFWCTGFPWAVIDSCIENRSLEFEPGQAAREFFLKQTRCPWDNLVDSSPKLLDCPACSNQVAVPWTDGAIKLPLAVAFEDCRGYADKSFQSQCPSCGFVIDHERLKVARFREDAGALYHHNRPMPGTLYSVRGLPEGPRSTKRQHAQTTFPNRFVKVACATIFDETHPGKSGGRCPTMVKLRESLEKQLRNKHILRAANPGSLAPTLIPAEKVAFRRMMSRYWDNVTPFALDLVGAVIRQGTFVQKMDNIDWLHSPTVMETMARLIARYTVFFYIMASNPRHMAVPTLDIDLAWHTHQLSPYRYFEYSTAQTKTEREFPVLIDHDDKVDENKLSDGFEWTSRTYKKVTNGEIYSECTCWYCEAIRVSDLRDSIFVSSTTARARTAAARLHDRPDISSNPDENPHISAHSAVRPATSRRHSTDPRHAKFLRLRSDYEKAQRRAEKRDRKEGREPRKRSPDDAAVAGYPLMWGFPVFVPYYAPYTCDPSVHADSYACNPSCMSLDSGAHGNCAAGTCGGGVAAGSCGGASGGACSGGCASGSCGGSSGGGGGCGGGGGGCGGGGGGGGCGGGGGGGGC